MGPGGWLLGGGQDRWLGLGLFGRLLDAGGLHIAENGTRLLLRVDPEFAAAIDVQPIEIAVVFDILGAGILVGGEHKTALDERAFDVLFGLVPLFREIVGADAHAGAALVSAEVRFDGVEKHRQLLFRRGSQIVPIVLRLVGRFRIIVAGRVHRLAETIVRGGLLFNETGGRRLGASGSGRGPRGGLEFRSKLRAKLLSLGLSGGRGGVRQRPVALRRAPREAGEGEQIVGRGVVVNNLPLVAAEIVQKFLQHRGRGKATFPARDDLIFPE